VTREGPTEHPPALFISGSRDFAREIEGYFVLVGARAMLVRSMHMPNQERRTPNPAFDHQTTQRRYIMSSARDQAKGKANQAAGAVKEKGGKILGDRSLEAKGKGQQVKGVAQEAKGKVKKVLKDD
jgi:uncharacterized protein YjbJ (UPF0337 family)